VRPGGRTAGRLATIDDLLVGYEQTVPLFVEALQAHRMALHQRPGLDHAGQGERLPHNRVWMTTEGVMPDDPVLHNAALVYSSDTTVLDSIITTHGLSWGHDRIFAVTVNHSVWFHRPIRFDEWVLYSTTSPVAADSRGLSTGHFFDPPVSCWRRWSRRASSNTSPSAEYAEAYVRARKIRVAQAITSLSD
jgi:acyl-CoA thioesterase-2